jgi:Holliday junction resolvase RusA-like endonuclease
LPLTSAEIEVEIVVADKKERRPDVDSILKPVLDALKVSPTVTIAKS